MVTQELDPAEIRGWALGLSALHQRISKHFVRAEPRQQAYNYLRALISPIERKMVGSSLNISVPPLLMAFNACLLLLTGTLTRFAMISKAMVSSTSVIPRLSW